MSGVDQDLIAAVATPPGQGGVGIIRISGIGARALAEQLCRKPLSPRIAVYTPVWVDDEVLDEGLLLYFPAPNSYTGEEVVEFQLHGSPVVMQRMLDALCQAGGRLARPGEFSERAFANEKLDLAQAEAVADLIASTSVQAARAAVRSLRGVFSERVNEIADRLLHLRILVEATLDFPEEEEDFLGDHDVAGSVASISDQIDGLVTESRQGRLVATGCAVALIGAPNAGKSSLLNLLSGEQTAIVTDIPGTTRDLLKVDLVVDGLPVHLVDTAGLREATDEVERIGVARAQDQAQQADLVLLLIDVSTVEDLNRHVAHLCQIAGLQVDDPRILLLQNKCDLLNGPPPDSHAIALSARTGHGLSDLKRTLHQRVGFDNAEPAFTARTRHVHALEAAGMNLVNAGALLDNNGGADLLAEELRSAHRHLGEIVGAMSADDLLGKIFSSFCIGK